ncbi:MAG: hypothetical protein IPG05_15715 [Gemmatimonadetes bacterium]|nr:hypothetical protein [Gemmatimonadota bacterium]
MSRRPLIGYALLLLVACGGAAPKDAKGGGGGRGGAQVLPVEVVPPSPTR